MMLQMKIRASHVLGKHSTIELYPKPKFFFFNLIHTSLGTGSSHLYS
jgi:hypothetical protein